MKTQALTCRERRLVHYRTTWWKREQQDGVWRERLLEAETKQNPEFFATIFINLGKINPAIKASIREALAEVAPLWSLAEKRRFMRTVATRADRWEFSVWAFAVNLGELEPVMFASDSVASLLELADAVTVERVREVVTKVSVLFKASPEEKLKMIRASRYHCESFEAVMLARCKDCNLESNIKTVCAKFDIPLPTPLRVKDAAKLARTWVKALTDEKISEKDFVTLIDCLVRDDEGTAQVVKIVSKQSKRASELVQAVVDQNGPVPKGIAVELKCWARRMDQPTRRDHAREWEIVEVGSAVEEVEELLVAGTSLAVTYRQTNDIAHAPKIAAFLFSRPDSEKKFLWRCLVAADADRQRLAQKLSVVQWRCLNPSEFKCAVKNTFGEKFIASNPLWALGNPGQDIERICKQIGLKYCPAGKLSPLLADRSVDASVVFHLAAELEIVRHAL